MRRSLQQSESNLLRQAEDLRDARDEAEATSKVKSEILAT